MTAKEENIIENEVDENFKMCYKLVTGKDVNSNDDFSNESIDSLLNVFESFNTSPPIKFRKLDLDENTKFFIETLLKKDDDTFIKLLLNDFSKEMKTKMREKDNYVILMRNSEKLILAHSKMGEQSITTNFDVFERLLDKDNVMRIVFFEKDEELIKVRHYEKNKSKFFIKWLGLPQKNLFYSFGGENKFYSEIQGFPIVLEINDEDIDSIKNNKYIDIDGENIRFENKISALPIKHIMRQRKKYNNYNDFDRDRISRKYDLAYYKDAYIKLNESLDPTISKIFDCETEVRGGIKPIEKSNKNLIMLFCNKQIEIDKNFLNKIKSLFLNDEPCKITHVGDDFSETPIEIGNVQIYNKFNLNLTKELLNYLNEVELPNTFKNELIYVILSCLKYDNPKMNITYFIDKFLSKFVKELKLDENNLKMINNTLKNNNLKLEKNGNLKIDNHNNEPKKRQNNNENYEKFDVFISYSSKDKEWVNELYNKLNETDLNIWYDNRLTIGDKLLETINNGLNNCEYGIIVLSEHYINSFWTKKEYSSLYPLIENGKLLPINHGLTDKQIAELDKTLLDVIYRSTDEYTTEEIAEEIYLKIKN